MFISSSSDSNDCIEIKDDLQTNSKTSELKSAFHCKACKLILEDKISLFAHRKSYHELTTYQCSFCGIRY